MVPAEIAPSPQSIVAVKAPTSSVDGKGGDCRGARQRHSLGGRGQHDLTGQDSCHDSLHPNIKVVCVRAHQKGEHCKGARMESFG
jgi:hypothetical protein